MKTNTAAILLALVAAASAQPSSFSEGDSYAWSANTGWIEFTPQRPNLGDGVVVTDTCLSGFAWSANTGWINFGDGAPADGIRYSNTTGADSGVNQDGAGNLSGLAWSANLGWVNFGWASAGDPNRPRFDIYHGSFTGYAWCPNTGWINLDTSIMKLEGILVTDSDGDGISDTWELERAGNLTILADGQDSDGDGIPDDQEYLADTNPLDASDRFRIIGMARQITGTMLEWTSRPTRLYRIHLSDDLKKWSLSSLGDLQPDAGVSTVRTAPHPAAPRQFFRVEARLPLQN